MGKTAILAVRIVGDAAGGRKAIDDTGTAAEGLFSKVKGGAAVAAGIGAAFVGGAVVAGKALFDIGSTWDEVKDGIRVGTGAAGEALEDLVDSAKNVAGAIPVAIEEIGPAIADVNTRMGLTGETLETVAAQYLEAGRILGETVDINKTSAAFGVFKVEGEAVEGAMDSLFQVSQATGVGMNDLADRVAKAGPALSNLGFGFEDAIALTGSLDKAGIDASATFASMQKGLVTLAQSGEEPAQAFNRIVGEVQGFVDTGETAAALDLASQVFGTRGAAQFVGALQSGTLGVEDLMSATGATTDTILGLGQETADAAEKWQLLKNKALVALEPIGSAVFDGVGAALDWLTTTLDGVDWEPFKAGLEAGAEALGKIGPLIETVGAWITGTLVPAVADVVATFRTYWDEAVAIVTDFVAQVQAGIEPLMPTIEGIFTTIGEIVTVAMELVGTIVAKATEAIRNAWEIIGPPIVGFVTTTWGAIVGVIEPAINLIKSVLKTVLAAIKGDWSGAWNGIKSIGENAWALIKGIVRGAIDVVKSTISGVLDAIKGLWSRGWDNVKTTLSGAWDGIKRATSEGIAKVKDYFVKLPGQITGALAGVGSKLYNIGADMLRGLINGIKSMGSRVTGAIGGIVTDGLNWAKRKLGIASPSKVFAQLGMWSGQGLAEGLAGQAGAVARAGAQLATAAIPDIPDIKVPGLAGGAMAGRYGAGAGAALVNITVNGALDPAGVARQIRDLLTADARIRGAINVNGQVLP